jgi:hypothetical protein
MKIEEEKIKLIKNEEVIQNQWSTLIIPELITYPIIFLFLNFFIVN